MRGKKRRRGSARKLLAVVLSLVLASQGFGCSAPIGNDAANSNDAQSVVPANKIDNAAAGGETDADETLNFSGLDDENLHQYVQDSVYAQLEDQLSEDYKVESVQAVYVSKEYLEELAYNSQENIYFGYSLNELEEHFEGTKYVFSLDEDGQTVAHAFSQNDDDTFAEVTRNVAIGSGVILVCATVSVATAGVAPAVSVVFAVSAVTATDVAVSSAVIGGAAAAVVTGIETGNPEEALEQAALAGSEGFKWGAITGAIAGGIDAAGWLYYAKSATLIPTPTEAEAYALERYGGEKQVSYLAGKEVAYGTSGSTRPDLVRTLDGHIEAIEVKDYDLSSPASVSELKAVLKRQVAERAENLPEGSTQRIALVTKGRDYSVELTDRIKVELQEALSDIYPNIPIDILT